MLLPRAAVNGWCVHGFVYCGIAVNVCVSVSVRKSRTLSDPFGLHTAFFQFYLARLCLAQRYTHEHQMKFISYGISVGSISLFLFCSLLSLLLIKESCILVFPRTHGHTGWWNVCPYRVWHTFICTIFCMCAEFRRHNNQINSAHGTESMRDRARWTQRERERYDSMLNWILENVVSFILSIYRNECFCAYRRKTGVENIVSYNANKMHMPTNSISIFRFSFSQSHVWRRKYLVFFVWNFRFLGAETGGRGLFCFRNNFFPQMLHCR